MAARPNNSTIPAPTKTNQIYFPIASGFLDIPSRDFEKIIPNAKDGPKIPNPIIIACANCVYSIYILY